MSELITRISSKDLPKSLREKYSAVEHVKETNRIAIYGIEKAGKKRKRIGVKSLLESYGHDPSKKPQPSKGIWQGPAGDVPVTVMGSYGTRDGSQEFMKVRSSTTGIARNEIKWLENNNDPSTIEHLENQISELQSQNTEFATRMGQLEGRLDQVLQDNERLNSENQALVVRNQELENQIQQYENEELDIVYEPYHTDSGSRAKGSFNKTFGWVGSRIPWRREPVYEDVHVERREGRPVVVVEEEIIDGYSEDDRRRGVGVVLGVLALAGVIALGIHELTEKDNKDSTIIKNQTTIIQQNREDATRDTTILRELRKDEIRDAAERIREIETLNNQKKILDFLQGKKSERFEGGHGELGQTFQVESGNGITNEIQEYAQTHNYANVSSGQAWMLYENMKEEFGADLIDVVGKSPDTYIRSAGDVGIASPGPAVWPSEVEEFIHQRLSSSK